MFEHHKNGAVCEFLAAAWFTNNGYIVSWPTGNFSEYDFIIDKKDEEPKRVQVKTIYFDAHKKRYISGLTLSHRQADGTTINKKYDGNSFDICAFVCMDYNAIYAVPIDKIIGRRSITFYPDRPQTHIKRPVNYERYKDQLIRVNNE